jgi:hypothetical protein
VEPRKASKPSGSVSRTRSRPLSTHVWRGSAAVTASGSSPSACCGRSSTRRSSWSRPTDAYTFEGDFFEARDARGPFVTSFGGERGTAWGGGWSWSPCIDPGPMAPAQRNPGPLALGSAAGGPIAEV